MIQNHIFSTNLIMFFCFCNCLIIALILNWFCNVFAYKTRKDWYCSYCVDFSKTPSGENSCKNLYDRSYPLKCQEIKKHSRHHQTFPLQEVVYGLRNNECLRHCFLQKYLFNQHNKYIVSCLQQMASPS